MSWTEPDPRRYRPEMPEIVWPHGIQPRERRRHREAMRDLADGLEGYLRSPEIPGERPEWAAWALQLGATNYAAPAPDGSRWFVRVVYG
jgi:hypothetical protein